MIAVRGREGTGAREKLEEKIIMCVDVLSRHPVVRTKLVELAMNGCLALAMLLATSQCSSLPWIVVSRCRSVMTQTSMGKEVLWCHCE